MCLQGRYSRKVKIIATELVNDNPVDDSVDEKNDKGFFGHPKSLATLFGVEMWERFSFYGVQGILLFYITYEASKGGLGLDKTTGKSIAGAYGGMVFLSTILFAWISDRLIGREKTLFSSTILVMIGHITMALNHGVSGLVIGLTLIAFGAGGVKASSTSMVGTLYKKNDPRTDAGFSLYYFGINVGAFLGPIVTGWLMDYKGFHYAFASAAFGMAIGVAQYTFRRQILPDITRHPTNAIEAKEKPKVIAIAVTAVVIIVALIAFVMASESRLKLVGANVSNIVIAFALVAALTIFALLLTTKKTTREEKGRVVAFIPLFISQVAFWALYQQIFTMLPDYADTKLNRNILGWEFPAAWVNSASAVYVIIMAVVFAAMWTKWGEKQPSTPMKFAFANTLIGVSYFLFIPVANVANNSAPVLWILLILWLFCVAELCISPIGLSVSTRLAPAKFATTMVALYMLASSIGTALAGSLATLYDSSKANNIPYFFGVGLASIIVGVLVFLSVPFVKKKMAGVR